jgi:hypothetical protein
VKVGAVVCVENQSIRDDEVKYLCRFVFCKCISVSVVGCEDEGSLGQRERKTEVVANLCPSMC